MALASGKSVKWTAEQLGHSSPMLTLKTYAHVMQEEEVDLSFADFGPGRPYTAPLDLSSVETKKPNATSVRQASEIVVELGGIEPPTPRLPALCSPS